MSKQRIDALLVEKGLCQSRERARTTVMTGVVFVNGQRVDKPAAQVDADAEIEVRGATLEYVSRGGLKLEKALDVFAVDPAGKTCLDCGASTGGFTDCLLRRGAVKVYAIDVGYGQLAWSLRSDSRVVTMERTNIRYVTREQVPDEIDLATIDVSFISLRLVLPVLASLLRAEGQALCLIKPQFEAGREKVGKKGVVRDRNTHAEVIENVLAFAKEAGFSVQGLTYSPVKGPEGNIEYLTSLRLGGESIPVDPAAVVEQSHRELDPA